MLTIENIKKGMELSKRLRDRSPISEEEWKFLNDLQAFDTTSFLIETIESHTKGFQELHDMISEYRDKWLAAQVALDEITFDDWGFGKFTIRTQGGQADRYGWIKGPFSIHVSWDLYEVDGAYEFFWSVSHAPSGYKLGSFTDMTAAFNFGHFLQCHKHYFDGIDPDKPVLQHQKILEHILTTRDLLKGRP